jgi:hypothetical protein
MCPDLEQSGAPAGVLARWLDSIHLGTVGEIWSLFLVAFLYADSKSCAVFAAATIEFSADFNV